MAQSCSSVPPPTPIPPTIFPLWNRGGSAGYQRNPGVIGLYGKEGASLHGALRHILCLAMGHRRGVGFPRNQGNAQYKGLAEPAVDSGKSVFIAYPKADIDSNLPALFYGCHFSTVK